MRGRRVWRSVGAAGAILATTIAAGPTAAQTIEPISLESPDWAAHLERVPRPSAPMIGLAIALPTGSAADPSTRPGVGRLAADAVVAEVEARLGMGDVEGRASVRPDQTVLTFLVRPERAAALLDALGDVGFGSGPSAGTMAAVRARRADVLRFEIDSPISEVGIERRTLLYGVGDPRTRPPGGTLDVAETSQNDEIEAARRALFRSGDARVVAVGPVEPLAEALPLAGRSEPVAAADTTAGAPGAASPEAEPVTAASLLPPGTTSAGPAWTTGDRSRVVRDVTNTWITVAFPIPADLPRVSVLFVADRFEQELDATPPDPGLFNVSVDIVEMPEGEVLMVEAAVLPDASDRFERRILELPQRLATERDPAFFRYHRGRFRARRLIADAPPEEAAGRMAAELLARGRILDFDEAVWDLDVEAAVRAATSLGPPRVLVFGPDLTGGDGP